MAKGTPPVSTKTPGPIQGRTVSAPKVAAGVKAPTKGSAGSTKGAPSKAPSMSMPGGNYPSGKPMKDAGSSSATSGSRAPEAKGTQAESQTKGG